MKVVFLAFVSAAISGCASLDSSPHGYGLDAHTEAPAPAPALITPLAPKSAVAEVPAQDRALVPTYHGETKWRFYAERIAHDSGCTDNPIGNLSAKGPAIETYSFVCRSGDVLTVRCEYEGCRVLK